MIRPEGASSQGRRGFPRIRPRTGLSTVPDLSQAIVKEDTRRDSRRLTAMAFVVAAHSFLPPGCRRSVPTRQLASTNPPTYYVLSSSQDIPSRPPRRRAARWWIFEAPADRSSRPSRPVDRSGGVAADHRPVAVHGDNGKTYTTDPQYATSQGTSWSGFTRETTSAVTGQPVEDLGFAFKNGLNAGNANSSSP